MSATPRRWEDRTVATRSNWFEDFLHGVATDLWRKVVSQEQTRAEADFLENKSKIANRKS